MEDMIIYNCKEGDNMRWTHKHEYRSDNWIGRKNGCKHTIATTNDDRYYILSTHVKTDLSLNTLWYDKVFDTLDEAKKYAENTINYTFITYTRDILNMMN